MPKRFDSIDQYRGFAIFFMLFGNLIPALSYGVPFILKHNQGPVLLPGDLIAPLFLFIIGVCMFISVYRRKKKGQPNSEITKHMLKRYVLLIAIGTFLNSMEILQPTIVWGVLEAIGLSGLIAFAILRFSMLTRVIISGAMLVAYSYLSTLPWFITWVTSFSHGGPLGVLSWTWIVIIGTVVGEMFIKKRRNFGYTVFRIAFVLMLAGFFVHVKLNIPFNKLIVSGSYSLFAAGFCTLIFLVFYYLSDIKKLRFVMFKDFGTSALMVWVFQSVFIWWPMNWFIGGWESLPLEQGVGLTLVIVIVFWLIVRFLNKRNIRLTL